MIHAVMFELSHRQVGICHRVVPVSLSFPSSNRGGGGGHGGSRIQETSGPVPDRAVSGLLCNLPSHLFELSVAASSLPPPPLSLFPGESSPW